MNRRAITMNMVAGLIFSATVTGLMFWGLVIKFPGALPVGCDFDGICENSLTEESRYYDNRLENEVFGIFPLSCWQTDCCYDHRQAYDLCRSECFDSGVTEPPVLSRPFTELQYDMWFNDYLSWLDDPIENPTMTRACRDCISKDNTEVLMDCIDSNMICDDIACVQSCDYDDICESGESTSCYDCR